MKDSCQFDIVPFFLVKKILSYIDDNITFKNARLTCRYFRRALDTYIIFNDRYTEKKIYFKNKAPIFIDTFISVSSDSILYRRVYYKHFKKSGPVIYYNHIGQLIKKGYYLNDRLDGYLTKFTNNRLVRKTLFVNGKKHGWEYTIKKTNNTRYDRKYEYNNIIYCVKYHRNKYVYRAEFLNGMINGMVILYFKLFNLEKNELNFKNNRLEGNSIIRQKDRILRCNFDIGYLYKTQIVYNLDNKIEFIGEYENNDLCGKYITFSNSSKLEEGIVDIFGRYNKCITYNRSEFERINYPLKKNILDGIYTEHIRNHYMKIGFSDNKFNGYFVLTDLLQNNNSYLKIYNNNNFEYFRKINNKCSYILKKLFGKYYLSINKGDDNYKTYDLTYFIGNKDNLLVTYDWV